MQTEKKTDKLKFKFHDFVVTVFKILYSRNRKMDARWIDKTSNVAVAY